MRFLIIGLVAFVCFEAAAQCGSRRSTNNKIEKLAIAFAQEEYEKALELYFDSTVVFNPNKISKKYKSQYEDLSKKMLEIKKLFDDNDRLIKSRIQDLKHHEYCNATELLNYQVFYRTASSEARKRYKTMLPIIEEVNDVCNKHHTWLVACQDTLTTCNDSLVELLASKNGFLLTKYMFDRDSTFRNTVVEKRNFGRKQIMGNWTKYLTQLNGKIDQLVDSLSSK